MINCKFENGNKASLRHVTIDVLVLKGHKVLLVKRTGKLLETGKWGVVGGFVERNETLTEAASREVYEETGWKIKNIKLLRIIDWPDRPKDDRQNISFVYFADAFKKTGSPDNESSEQKWFDLDRLPPQETFAFDHFQDIEFYLKNLPSYC